MEEGGAYLDNGGVLFAPFYEFVIGELGVFILVHVSKDLVDALRRRLSTDAQPEQNWMQRTFSGVSSSEGSLTISPVIL